MPSPALKSDTSFQRTFQRGTSCDRRNSLTEVTMELDEAYDGDLDEASLEQDAVWFERVPPELECDESDISTAVADLVGASRMRSYT
jgi:hypothetical protein